VTRHHVYDQMRRQTAKISTPATADGSNQRATGAAAILSPSVVLRHTRACLEYPAMTINFFLGMGDISSKKKLIVVW
jgi:hypothetical protein